jgi:hypothetical protein
MSKFYHTPFESNLYSSSKKTGQRPPFSLR